MNYNFRDTIEQLSNKDMINLPAYLKQLADKPLYLYGAGCFGKELYEVLQQHGYGIEGFIDRDAATIKEYCGCSVFQPQLLADKTSCRVVISIVMDKLSRKQLEESLHSMGFCDIVDGQSIRAHYVYGDDIASERNRSEYFSAFYEMMEHVDSLWADEESRQTYRRNLTAHLQRDYSDCIQTEDDQYFVKSIPLAKGFSRFIDCGAYIGDTLQALSKTEKAIEAIAGFEPNLNNFRRMSEVYDKELRRFVKQGVLFPCGVAGETKLQHFNLAGGSSAIIQNGGEIIQCVALDDVLKDFSPTFIKMDIEGVEYEALQGARNMIEKYKPDLAIAVYHSIDHFYTIPSLIHSWNLGYKFYLRTHSSCCMETILYAVDSNQGGK